MDRRSLLRAGLGLTAAAALPSLGSAQAKYPEKPVRLLIPFPPGGPTDLFGRKFADKIGPVLGQQMIVENRAGGAGSIGAAEAARAKPDGYTLLFATSSTHAMNPTSMPNVPYDAVKDFSPVALVGIVPLVLAVHPAVPAKDLREWTALIKANPGKYSFGSSGAGGITHLGGELYKQQAGNLDLLHVPYKGSNPALQDTLSGHIPMLMETFGTTLQHHRAGKLRILAVFNTKRSEAASDIPTAIEQGVPEAVAYTFNMVTAPAGTPKPAIDALLAATHKVMADQAFLADLKSLAIEPVSDSDPAKAEQFVKDEIRKWAPIIKATGTVSG